MTNISCSLKLEAWGELCNVILFVLHVLYWQWGCMLLQLCEIFTSFFFSCFSYVGKADPEYYGIKPQPIFLSFNCFSTVSQNINDNLWITYLLKLNYNEGIGFIFKKYKSDCLIIVCELQSGYVTHELGHALGLFHEHQRPDRDDYISVVRENIKTGQESNFSPVNPTFIDYLGVPYDLTSDMHYRAGVSNTQLFCEFAIDFVWNCVGSYSQRRKVKEIKKQTTNIKENFLLLLSLFSVWMGPKTKVYHVNLGKRKKLACHFSSTCHNIIFLSFVTAVF